MANQDTHNVDELARYSRSNYGSGRSGAHDASAPAQSDNAAIGSYYGSSTFDAKFVEIRKKRKRKRVITIVVGVLVALLAAAGVAVALYINNVSNAMSLGEGGDEIRASLSTADFDKPFYMLLVGSDWRENSGVTTKSDMTGDQQRADVIVLARVDRPNKRITLLSIPRDTPHRKSDGSYEKLNEVYNGGRGPAMIAAVQELTGAQISHYAEVYFSDFENLINILGGVELDIPTDLSGTDALTDAPITIKAGLQTLNGTEAMMYARERKTLEGNQDAARQSNIRTIIEAIVKKVRTMPISEMPNILYGAASCVRTDLSFDEILYLANDFRGGIKLYNGSGPTAGERDEAAGNYWLCYVDDTGWQRVMDVVDAGKDPENVSYVGDVVHPAGSDKKLVVQEDGTAIPVEEAAAATEAAAEDAGGNSEGSPEEWEE